MPPLHLIPKPICITITITSAAAAFTPSLLTRFLFCIAQHRLHLQIWWPWEGRSRAWEGSGSQIWALLHRSAAQSLLHRRDLAQIHHLICRVPFSSSSSSFSSSILSSFHKRSWIEVVVHKMLTEQQ